jgi:heme/copper-type cytochrome/quinol oxidase subunit 2
MGVVIVVPAANCVTIMIGIAVMTMAPALAMFVFAVLAVSVIAVVVISVVFLVTMPVLFLRERDGGRERQRKNCGNSSLEPAF